VGRGGEEQRERYNREYTWINLSAKEALSYKTGTRTRDTRDRIQMAV
jgi:hypothetical protein